MERKSREHLEQIFNRWQSSPSTATAEHPQEATLPPKQRAEVIAPEPATPPASRTALTPQPILPSEPLGFVQWLVEGVGKDKPAAGT